jgi:hypothetical protein
MITRRKYPSSWKSLLHFDYPYPGQAGDGLRDELGLVTWTWVGSPLWVGTEAPVDATIAGTPRYGYRCLSTTSAASYVQGDNPSGVWNLSSGGSYEIEFWFRPVALNVALNLFEIRDTGGAVLLASPPARGRGLKTGDRVSGETHLGCFPFRVPPGLPAGPSLPRKGTTSLLVGLPARRIREKKEGRIGG